MWTGDAMLIRIGNGARPDDRRGDDRATREIDDAVESEGEF
jgi:hypothetical protein